MRAFSFYIKFLILCVSILFMNFWSHFAKASRDKHRPILCLAPMADVTDRAFRQIIAKYSKLDFQSVNIHDSSVKTSSSLSTDKSLLAFSSSRLSQPAKGTLNNYFFSLAGSSGLFINIL